MLANCAAHQIEDPVPAVDTLSLAAVDLKHLRRYTLGDVMLEREVLDLFLAQLPITIAALKGAASEREWRVAAHTLKGSGRAVGAWHLARLAELAERTAPGKNRNNCSEAVARIEAAAEETRQFILGAYASVKPAARASAVNA